MKIVFKTVEYQTLSAGDTFLWASDPDKGAIQSSVYMIVDPCGMASREGAKQRYICINLKDGKLCAIEYGAKVIPIRVDTTADATTLEIEAA